MEMVSSYPAQAFDAGCADAVRRAADTLGYSNMPVVSGAGHDAVYMARLAPTGMIFIPCKDGISHNEIVAVEVDDIAAALAAVDNVAAEYDSAWEAHGQNGECREDVWGTTEDGSEFRLILVQILATASHAA